MKDLKSNNNFSKQHRIFYTR